jgi:hypothetical protein
MVSQIKHKILYGGAIYSDCEIYLKKFSDFIVKFNQVQSFKDPLKRFFIRLIT